jgi:hypothetical protein
LQASPQEGPVSLMLSLFTDGVTIPQSHIQFTFLQWSLPLVASLTSVRLSFIWIAAV